MSRSRRLRRIVLVLIQGLVLGGSVLLAAASGPDGPPKQWAAQWIATPDGPARDYSVVYFRKTVALSVVPTQFVVDVSADTRFELHVNGKRVGAGPALADVHHWRYETFDLAPYLHQGENYIAAIVWNFGTSAPIAQMSSQTAFLLSAEDPRNSSVNTGDGWQASLERGRTLGRDHPKGYYAAGPAEVMDGRRMNWDWDRVGPNPSGEWSEARSLGHAGPRGARDSPTRWILEKDGLPPMQYEPVSAGEIVRAVGIAVEPATSMEKPMTIPANSNVTLLLDRGALTTAYPSLQINGGNNASIDLTYAEALYDAKGEKGNRNEIADRHIEGISDHVVSDGGRRSYRTLWWRTWRYMQVDVKTSDTPLTIDGLTAFYTAYPFSAAARFSSDDTELGRIWETGWRTAQLCAHETYMDTPYWEQLQYIGDTRIQALISYGVTGDDRLARQAMMAYRDSLLSEGLTQSRYPSSLTQVIPPFSLLWVGMLHDFWWYRDDPAFVKLLLPGTRGVLDWFAARQRADGLLGYIEWWPFVDWSPPLYVGGVPPQEADGGSSALTLQFVEALRYAAELEDRFGEKERATLYREQATRAAEGLLRLNWDESVGLLADTPLKKSFSQQANSLAVWLDVVPKEKQQAVMSKVLGAPSGAPGSATSMSEASYYFRFYVARAMVHAGLGDEYISQLEPWRKMLRLGLSTWAETPEPTRSDSHAWSAHPTFDLLALVAGIEPASQGFHSVRIAPHLGQLQRAAATMPTPKGLVEVRYTREGSGWAAVITLPDGLPGELSWHQKVVPLHAGEQTIRLSW
jgi:alpha-L-rhamnosidase